MKPELRSHRKARKNAVRTPLVRTASSISTFLAGIQVAAKVDGTYAFRGQEDESWPVEAAASRRWRKFHDDLAPTPDQFVRYHTDTLVNPAKLRGHHRHGGRQWTDLELLANLQHHGAATGLIDFTLNPLNALWFACRPASSQKDGIVFMVNLDDHSQYKSVTAENIGETADDLFQQNFAAPGLRYWHPEEITPRVAHQAGIFIFGKPSVPEDAIVRKIKIPHDSKEQILANLNMAHNITEIRLYGDFYGFAALNHVDSPVGF